MKKVALIPGSFDPPTRAHAQIWKELAPLFWLVIGIGQNVSKPNALFRPETRKTLIERVLKDLSISADVLIYEDLIDECAKRVGADVVIRGLRGIEDLSSETAIQDYLDRRGGPPTLYKTAPAELRTCSSTFVRGLLPFAGESADRDLEVLLPRAVYRCVCRQLPLMRAWFLSLWKDLDAVGDPHVVFEDLLLRYSDGVREYHTLTHVQWGLARLEDMRRELGNTCGIDWQIVKFAYWFHDAIMDRSTDNEERSAELAKTVALKAGIAHMRALHAADLIRSTAHRTFPSEPDAAALVDADLSILGASSEAFDRYEHQVREEWSDVPEELFRKLRSDILTKFLERPTIYTSMYGQTHWESEAYANLERSIARLQCGVLP